MDIEAARESRVERAWYTIRRLWRNHVTLINRPILRNYLVWFLAVTVVLALCPEIATVPKPSPVPSVAVHDIQETDWYTMSLEYWERFFAPVSEESCPVPEEVQEPSSPDLSTLFEGLQPLGEIRNDAATCQRLEATVSRTIPLSQQAPHRKRQKNNLVMGLNRVQEQLLNDIQSHDELCLAGVHVGVPIRMMVLKTLGTLVNPVIIESSKTTRNRLEATAFHPSLLKEKLRPSEVTIQFDTLDADLPQTKTLMDVDAQCVLHLIDAMDAIPFLTLQNHRSKCLTVIDHSNCPKLRYTMT